VSKYISIDLESQGLFAVSGTTTRSASRIEHAVAWTGPEAEGGPPTLTPETARRVGEQLRDRLRAAGVGHAPVVVTVGRDRVVLKELRYPAVAPHEEPNVVRFQALKELSDSPEDIVLDYVPLTNGAGTGERRSMAVAVRKDLYAAIQTMCAAANLKLVAVTPRPYATAAGIGRAFDSGIAPAPDSKADAVAVLTLGPGGGEFTVVRGGEVTFTLAVPAPVVASDAMLLSQVRRNLTTYASANPGHPVQALYVADTYHGWAERFRPALGIPVHAFDPLGEAARDVPEELRGRFAGAAGLLAARGGVLPINFAAPRQPRAEADPKKNQILLVALAALVLVALGGFGGWWMLNAAEQDVAQLTQERDEKKATLDRGEPDRKRLEAADKWKARRVSWLDELYDMTARFPPTAKDLYASNFTGKSTHPVAPKSGAKQDPKQDNQGTVSVRVASRSTEAINLLLTEIEGDNPRDEPKTGLRNDPKIKYYLGVRKVPSTTPPQYDKNAQEATISASVNARPPSAYTRLPAFEPPSRKGYPPQPAAPKESKPAEPAEPAVAPAPKDKAIPAE
jgi:hypothetical protein